MNEGAEASSAGFSTWDHGPTAWRVKFGSIFQAKKLLLRSSSKSRNVTEPKLDFNKNMTLNSFTV